MTNTAIITYIKNISYAYGKVLYQKIGLVETYLDRVMIFVVCVRIATELQQNTVHTIQSLATLPARKITSKNFNLNHLSAIVAISQWQICTLG